MPIDVKFIAAVLLADIPDEYKIIDPEGFGFGPLPEIQAAKDFIAERYQYWKMHPKELRESGPYKRDGFTECHHKAVTEWLTQYLSPPKPKRPMQGRKAL